MGMMGYHRPNIDRRANEGMLFTDSYRSKVAPLGAPPSSVDKACIAPEEQDRCARR